MDSRSKPHKSELSPVRSDLQHHPAWTSHGGDLATRTGIFWEVGKPHTDPLEHNPFLGLLTPISFQSSFPNRSSFLWALRFFDSKEFLRFFSLLQGATKLFLLPALGSASSPALIHCGHWPASQGLHSCIKKLKSFQFCESSEQGTVLNPNPISWDQIDDYSS